MPVIYREGENSGFATMAIVLVVALFALLVATYGLAALANAGGWPR